MENNTNSLNEHSQEEAIEALRNGEGSLKMIAQMPDGSEKEVAIWGGYNLDGFDRTLNVFVDTGDLRTFFNMAIEGSEEVDTTNIKDPCENDEGFQITADYLNLAATSVVRKGQGKLTTEMFARDDKKSFRDVAESGTGEMDLNEDGTLTLSGEILRENKFLVFAVSLLTLRRYLLKKGVVQELYDMFDESAGVLVEVSESGKISYRIVKGSERPELPCNVFLLGEQMCRPYIDEMLNLKSPSTRKKRD